MACVSGTNIVNDGLVFHFDLENGAKSWKGKPTSNLAVGKFFDGNKNFTIDENITDTMPDGSIGTARLFNAQTVIDPNRTVSIGSYSLTAGETYTLSFYVMNIDCTGFRGNLYSRTLGRAIGRISYPSVSTTEWTRVTTTFTVPNEGPNPVTLSPQAFRDGGIGRFKMCWLQMEQGSIATKFVNGVRLDTANIIDLSPNKNTITAANLTYRQDDTPTFDGTNDYMLTDISTINQNATYEIWVKRYQSVNSYNMMMGQYLPYFAFRSDNRIHFSSNISGQKNLYTDYNAVSDNTWYNIVFVHDYDGTNTDVSIYVNGEIKANNTYAGAQSTNSGRNFMIAGWRSDSPTSEPFNGEISQVKIYDKALTSAEVKQNFEATRTRYGI